MSTPFLPGSELGLIDWGSNFKTKITLAPTTFGLTAAQATSYGTVYDAFVDAHTVANNPATRSPMNVELKNQAKVNFTALARQLAGVVQRFPGTTNAMRIDLRLTPRDIQPTPIGPPAKSPTILVKSVVGRTVEVNLIDADEQARRGLPLGVDGITVLSYVGDAPPESTADWKFEGSTSRTRFQIVFPVTVPAFAKVWLTAFYFSPRKQSGAACAPKSCYLGSAELPQAA